MSVVKKNPTTLDLGERRFQYNHDLTHLRFTGNQVECAFNILTIEQGDFEVTRCFLRLESDDQTVELPATTFSHAPGAPLEISAEFDLSAGPELVPLRYHFYVELRDKLASASIMLRINHLSAQLYKSIHRRFRAPAITLPGDRVFTLATNLKTSRMGFLIHQQSRYDRQLLRQRFYERVGACAAALGETFRPSKKPIALLYEKEARTAQDNSFALQLHLSRTKENLPFDHAYIIDPDSEQWSRVRAHENVVPKFSLRYWYLLARNDSFLVSSESRFHLAHLYSRPDRANRYLFRKKHYFLQHGVTGLKRVSVFTPGSAVIPDYTVATSGWEKKVIAQAGMKAASIDITGFARWDRLAEPAETPAPVKSILYMPTWRNWLEGQNAEELSQSDYLKTTLEFLTSPVLSEMLQAHNAKLLFIPHPKAIELLDAVAGLPAGVELVNQNEIEFSELIQTTDALITDYSSIVWDFIRATKPVALFEFDKDRYDKEVGAFKNRELNSVVNSLVSARTTDQMLNHISHLLASPPEAVRAEAERLLAKSFAHSDRGNSHRIVYALVRRLTSLTTLRSVPTYAQADAGFRRYVHRTIEFNHREVRQSH